MTLPAPKDIHSRVWRRAQYKLNGVSRHDATRANRFSFRLSTTLVHATRGEYLNNRWTEPNKALRSFFVETLPWT